MTEPRFLFLAPDIRGSSGGVAVLYLCAEILRTNGLDAVVVHQSRRGQYWNVSSTAKVAYTYCLRRRLGRGVGLLVRLKKEAGVLVDWFRGGSSARLTVQPSDILVVPEFMLAMLQRTFPASQKIVFVQNPFSYLPAVSASVRQGTDPHGGVALNLGVSQICLDALELTDASPIAHVPVGPSFERFRFAETKKLQIAYMPRKRWPESRVVVDALRRCKEMNGVELIEIDGQPQDSVAKILAESMFFISFMRRESLGFPAMEAMASGCVVIGYTGLGGREYFDSQTGIPVVEDDTPALVHAVEGAVAAYRRDPTVYEEMRRRAAALVSERYSRGRTEKALLDALACAGLLVKASEAKGQASGPLT